MEDRSRWTVKHYQRALASRGAKVSGRKKELIDRLEAYERNDNFGAQPIISELDSQDPLPNFPSISEFRTLTHQGCDLVPKIVHAHVEQYVLFRQELGPKDNVAKAIMHGEKMIGEVLALSYYRESAVPSAEEGSNALLYITGIVRAEMRTTMTYNMKLVIDAGENGEVMQSHCECPAGRGPTGTCKHTVAVLLVLVKFADDGILEVQHSCTDELQTFKKPTGTHKGSPVRAEELGKAIKKRDPRPEKYRNMEGYPDYVYNMTTNFCAETGLDVTMRYNYPKADVQKAQLDHDYLALPFVQY